MDNGNTSRGYRRWHQHIPSHQEHVQKCDLRMSTYHRSRWHQRSRQDAAHVHNQEHEMGPDLTFI